MFKKIFFTAVLTVVVQASVGFAAQAASVPEPFQGHNPDSKFTINYDDIDAILKVMVVDVGRSLRKKAPETHARTGTRMKTKVSRNTMHEANRFHFEEFENNEKYQQALHSVRKSLESIPGRMPLEHFNRKEQLAYWLNLYNITVLDEIVRMYPERDLKKEIVGRKSILEPKILNVAGVPLSLNDIQYTILASNYDNDPLIMYGLFQGNIGGPNIRKRAYTSENVYRFLQQNAEEFINSNRGTYSQYDEFEVSSLYERNKRYFPNFEADLKQHLLRYIEGPERTALNAANTLKPGIDDWTIADVSGTYRQIGGSFATSQAAMIDAVIATAPDGQGGTVVTSFSAASSKMIAKSPALSEFDPEQLGYLTAIKEKEEAANLMREGRVTVEELGVAPDQAQEKEPEDEE